MNYSVFIIICCSVGGVILALLLAFLIQGAPFVATNDETTKTIVKVMGSLPAKKIIDLGCGDGKLVIQLAKEGYRVDGIEIKPWLVRRARKRIHKLGLDDKAQIYKGNFWKFNVSKYDTVVLFAIPHIMSKLEKKLTKELKPKSYVVSNFFIFPEHEPLKRVNQVTIYKF